MFTECALASKHPQKGGFMPPRKFLRPTYSLINNLHGKAVWNVILKAKDSTLQICVQFLTTICGGAYRYR